MSSSAPSASATSPTPWLLRIPEIFDGMAEEILTALGVEGRTRLGQEYHLVKVADGPALHRSEAAKFIRWNLPLEHSWPCNPQKMDGFIEKAAQTLLRKFGDQNPQGIFIGPLNAASPDRYYKGLASNLRGRVLQLFPKLPAANVEEQDPNQKTLFCLVGREGLFCGMQTPRLCNGFYPGGSKFIDQDSPDTISRAGAKIAEALHYLGLHRPALPKNSHWLELGACPGGMTSELLAREQRVTAIDRAALDRRLNGRSGLRFIQADVATFTPPLGSVYDALLTDMNGPPFESLEQVIRLSANLRKGGLVVFTLKVPRIENVKEPCDLFRSIVKAAVAAGFAVFAQTHLTYNRHEFTLFFEKRR